MNENNKSNQNSNENNTYTHSDLKGFHKAVPILLTAAALIIFAGLFSPDTGFGKILNLVFGGLLGFGAWAIPVAMLLHALFYAEDLGKGKIKHRVIFSASSVLIVAMVECAITFWGQAISKDNFNLISFFTGRTAGGFIGGALSYVPLALFGSIGVIIVAATALALLIVFLYADNNGAASRLFFTILEYGARFLAVIERWVIDLIGRIKEAIAEKRQREMDDRHAELVDDDFFEVDNGMKSMSIKEIGFSTERSDDDFAESPTLHSKIHMKSVIKEEPNPKSEVKAEPTPAPSPVFTERQSAKAKTMNLNYSFDHLKADKPEPVAEVQDDGELIAVITAAIAAMIESGDYKNEFVGGFRVVSFKRTTSGAWNKK